jgi:hypothetical protein
MIQTYDLFDYANWLPGNELRRKKSQTPVLLLRYERPQGRPVIYWFVDDHSLSVDAATGSKPKRNGGGSHASADMMTEAVYKLARNFGLRLGQALFFVSKRAVTFGAIMPFASLELGTEGIRGRFVTAVLQRLKCGSP